MVLFLVDRPILICNDCDPYLDIPVTMLVTSVFEAILVVNIVFTTRKMIFMQKEDSKRIQGEFYLYLFLVSPITFIIWTLVIIDPGRLLYKREFNWAWIFIVHNVLVWWASFGNQVFQQWRENRKWKTFVSQSSHLSMTDLWKTDKDLYQQFEKYAENQYVVELVYYLQDVEIYKNLFYDKPDSWKKSKFINLVQKYILTGSNFEINISHNMRNKIIRVYEEVQRSNHLELKMMYRVFDDSVEEIRHLLQDGAWKSFLFQKKKAGTFNQVVDISHMQ